MPDSFFCRILLRALLFAKERKMSSEVPRAHSDREANKSQFANCNIYLAAVGQSINQKSERETEKDIF